MKTFKFKLNNDQIEDVKREILFYTNLIKKEFSYGDLKSDENISMYRESLNGQRRLLLDGFIEIELPSDFVPSEFGFVEV